MEVNITRWQFTKDFYQTELLMTTKAKNKINDYLWDNRLTVSELADKLDLHPVTISRWRNGRKTIPRTIELALKALADQEKALAHRK